MGRSKSITFSAPGKVHLLGEHAVVYGKPALLTTVDLRVYVTISKKTGSPDKLTKLIQKVVESVIKKYLKVKTIPYYQPSITFKLPIGSGLGSSAAVSASYIAALLSFLKLKWDLDLINKLTYEAEKVFHGNPSGADPATVIFGRLIWFRKETSDLKLINQLPFSISSKLTKSFVLINTGKPKETTKDMVNIVKKLYQRKPKIVKEFLNNQEQLVKDLLLNLQYSNEKKIINIIREGEKNLESIGVVSKQVKSIIRVIEKAGGSAKICGGGGKSGPTGVLLSYHKNPSVLEKIAKSYNLDYFKTALGVEGLRREI